MAEFRGFIHSLISETKQLLTREVLLLRESHQLPAIPWKTLRDDPSNKSIGWSFLCDRRNQWPTDGRQWLFQRIGDDPVLQKRFLHDN